MRKLFSILILLSFAIALVGCVKVNDTADPEIEDVVEEITIKDPDTVSFVAAGDNLIHGAIYLQALRRGNGEKYDFDYCYQYTEDYFDNFDVRFINQETLVNDAYKASTYPQFSTPIDMGEKVIEMGFNVIGTSNNHSYDMGTKGIYSSLDYWNSKDVVNVGFYTDNDDVDIKYLEKNNIKLAFLAYTYGTNGLSIYDENCPHIINIMDFDTIERQVKTAKENADVVIVSCHWGYEDTNNINDLQRVVADKLNILGVDVIIGTHPHVIQTVEWHTNEENDNKTLICYSLGNFISAQAKANNMLGGIFQFNIVKTYDQDENFNIEITEPYFVPTITHYDYGVANIRNYILKDYTPDLAAVHGVRQEDSRFSYDYIENIVYNVIPKEFLLYK